VARRCFDRKTVEVSPKKDTNYTWQWYIKDTDRRTLPLTDELIELLVRYQSEQPEGCPYVFIPPWRYDVIQKIRRKGKWSTLDGNCPLTNFDRQFIKIMKVAAIQDRTFHNLWRTCLSHWLANGLKEYEVMRLAGHSSFETTRKFYLAVREDLLDRARTASAQALAGISIASAFRG
jgi:integrase